jgi:hypothetical protein
VADTEGVLPSLFPKAGSSTGRQAVKKPTVRVTTSELVTSNTTTAPEVTAKSTDTGIPCEPANTAQEPTDKVPLPDPTVIESPSLQEGEGWLLPARAIQTWPERKPKQKKLREAGRSSISPSQLHSIGRPTPEAVEICTAQPDRTAVDDILEELQAGDPELFFLALSLSPAYLHEPPIYAATIGTWWPQKKSDTPEGENARKYLRRIGSVLADPLGRPEITKAEREQNKQTSNLQAQHDRRALQYCNRAWQKYIDAKERLKTEGITDTSLFLTVVSHVVKEEFSRGKAAKEEGKRLFLQRVKQDLA